MLTEETADRIAYGLACVQLAQRLRDLPADHPLAIQARADGIEPIDEPGPPSIALIAKYARVSKSTLRKFEAVTLARFKKRALQHGLHLIPNPSNINHHQSSLINPQ
jgi:hypothetical protein